MTMKKTLFYLSQKKMKEEEINFMTEMERYIEVISFPDQEYQIYVLQFYIDDEGLKKLRYQITKFWTVYNIDDNSSDEQGMIFMFCEYISPNNS